MMKSNVTVFNVDEYRIRTSIKVHCHLFIYNLFLKKSKLCTGPNHQNPEEKLQQS